MGDQSWDPKTRAAVQKIPLLTVKAGPRDKEEWQKRLKEVGIGFQPKQQAACAGWFRCCAAASAAGAAGAASPQLLTRTGLLHQLCLYLLAGP